MNKNSVKAASIKIVKKQLKTEISLSELKTYEVPVFQRWKNEQNVSNLVNSVNEIGQQRDIMVCQLPNGRRIKTDGRHLEEALGVCGFKKANVTVNYVESEEDAFKLFRKFNTIGKTLSSLDFVVSYANYERGNSYDVFLNQILNNPNNELEANKSAKQHGLFTVPALINIFLGATPTVRSGKSKLPFNYEWKKGVLRYIDTNYIYDNRIRNIVDKKGKSRKLNGAAIQEVFKIITSKKYNNLTSNKILEILIDFTLWFDSKNPNIKFTKDVCEDEFKVYLKEINL